MVYAAAVYLLFLAVLGYAVGFFAGFGVPKGIDQGPRAAVPAGHSPSAACTGGSGERDGTRARSSRGKYAGARVRCCVHQTR